MSVRTKVNRYTRAGRDGREIECPCGWRGRVYHFAWSALGCQECNEMVAKGEWLVVAPRLRVQVEEVKPVTLAVCPDCGTATPPRGAWHTLACPRIDAHNLRDSTGADACPRQEVTS